VELVVGGGEGGEPTPLADLAGGSQLGLVGAASEGVQQGGANQSGQANRMVLMLTRVKVNQAWPPPRTAAALDCRPSPRTLDLAYSLFRIQ
jgi:hypothetical protein